MDMDSERGNEKSDDSKAGAEETPLSKGALIRKKLILVAGYMLDGFAPVVAVIALIVAVMALNGNKSGQTMVGQSASRLDNLNANLSATKGELEKLRATLGKEKALQDDERKKLDERLSKTIQAVSLLQTKAKVSPTLEEQLSQPVVKTVVAPSSSVIPATTTATVAPAVKGVVTPGSENKTGEQTKVLKEAIEKFNKK